MHCSSETKAGDGIGKGTSGVVSALGTEEDASSSEGTVVSSGGRGGDRVGCNEAEKAVGVPGKDPSPLSW